MIYTTLLVGTAEQLGSKNEMVIINKWRLNLNLHTVRARMRILITSQINHMAIERNFGSSDTLSKRNPLQASWELEIKNYFWMFSEFCRSGVKKICKYLFDIEMG